MPSAALICVCVPPSVSVALAAAPATIFAPPVKLTSKTPLVAVTCTVARFPSASLTETPVTASEPFAVFAPGTVLTGALFTIVPAGVIGCESTPSEAHVVELPMLPCTPWRSWLNEVACEALPIT